MGANSQPRDVIWTLCTEASNEQELLVRNCDCCKGERADHAFINAALWTKTLTS